MSDKPKPRRTTISKPIKKLCDRILAEHKAGNIVHWGLPGQLMTVHLEEFIKQPVDGILYDLNRSEEISMTFLKDPKWVNDFAVAKVIRKLYAELQTTRDLLSSARDMLASRAEKPR